LLGTSAWEAPAQAIADMCASIYEGDDEMFTASVWREEYGCCIGSLIQLTEDAYSAPKVYIDKEFEESVKERLLESVEAVKKVNESLI
jgi:malate/lactate dehydrogenase